MTGYEGGNRGFMTFWPSVVPVCLVIIRFYYWKYVFLVISLTCVPCAIFVGDWEKIIILYY